MNRQVNAIAGRLSLRPPQRRSLATWAETDLGKFHQGVSLLMFCAGGLLTAVALYQFTGRPGTGYLVIGLLSTATSTLWDLWPSVFRTSDASPSSPAQSTSPRS